MESSMKPSCPLKAPQKASNYDELLMQHSLNFAHSLKDLKGLQEQLYSAAEYFELSYSKDEEKQLLIETFKDYTTKALVSTVDHLGSVASKLNDFLEVKAGEVSAAKLRFTSIEQRIHKCRGFNDLNGHCQQSVLISTPKHHKRYIASDGGTLNAIEISELARDSHIPSFQDNLHRTYQVSPFRFSLKRAGSAINRSSSLRFSHDNDRRAPPSEPRRSIVMGVNTGRNKEEMAFYCRKSKNLLKALLSIHKSKKEGVPSRIRDG